MPFSQKLKDTIKPSEDDSVMSIKAWQADPSPQNADLMLQKLQPTLDKIVYTHVGGTDSPTVRSRARSMALNALTKFDPTQVKPHTYLFGQLQGLKRFSRRHQQILKIPERASLERASVQRTEAELEDELGRSPSSAEVAGRMGISLKRLTKIRSFGVPFSEGGLASKFDDQGEPMDSAVGVVPTKRGPSSWVEMVYHDMDPVNKFIMDYGMGLHGNRPISNMDIAKKLKVTPGAVSQRRRLIQDKLDMEKELSPFGFGG